MTNHEPLKPADDQLAVLIRDAGPPPPSLVDVDAAIRSGDRRVWRRRAVAVAGVAAMAALTVAAVPVALEAVGGGADRDGLPAASGSASSGPPTACTVNRLSEPAGAYQSHVTAADPTGRYIAARTYFSQGTKLRQMIWDNGAGRQLDIPGEDATLGDINSHGVAVGSSMVSEETHAAWIYRDGKVTRLAGGDAAAVAINDRGDVAGIVYKGLTALQPVLWRGGQGEPIPLALPANATTGSVHDIAEDGRVVGGVGDRPNASGHRGSAYLWQPDGRGRALPTPPRSLGSSAYAIRGDWVVGSAAQPLDEPGHTPVTLRWNLRADTVEIMTRQYGMPTVNAQGWVAGDREFGEPYLDTGTTTLKLPGLGADHGPPNSNQSLVANVTDDGRTLAGHVHAKTGGMHAVVWRCS